MKTDDIRKHVNLIESAFSNMREDHIDLGNSVLVVIVDSYQMSADDMDYVKVEGTTDEEAVIAMVESVDRVGNWLGYSRAPYGYNAYEQYQRSQPNSVPPVDQQKAQMAKTIPVQELEKFHRLYEKMVGSVDGDLDELEETNPKAVSYFTSFVKLFLG